MNAKSSRQVLNRIACSLGDEPLRHREWTASERRSLVADAERAIDRNWGTDLHEAVSESFAALLADLDVALRAEGVI